jgi:membrane protease YdiL (CAAX protease family)
MLHSPLLHSSDAGDVYGFFYRKDWRSGIQTRLNEVIGRPYRLFGVSWGVGLIFASILFGLIHTLSTLNFNPFIGKYYLDITWGLFACISGLTFGFVREKTGNIVAPAILQSAFDYLSVI